MSFRYGYLEMKAKVPFQKGMWASFWMIPDPSASNAGDYVGEIDIFETYGDITLKPALHRWYRDPKTGKSADCKPSDKWNNNEPVTLDGEYHTFALEWTPTELIYYIDDVEYSRMSITEDADYCTHNGAHDDGMACFQKYYCICLGNHIYSSLQGNWMVDQQVENLPDFAQNGVDFKIDYIRLYQNEDAGEDFVLY